MKSFIRSPDFFIKFNQVRFIFRLELQGRRIQ
ncbi:hypothetical protein OPIT5_00670 [Opitutaceae bacterium TAV5]|nr:hypothetical protein OPIT5_00670 [Opitutaceae bacterium TAV5]